MKTGTLVDATIIASASEDDAEGHWVQHKGRPAVHGFKAHVGADADTALVEEIAVTPANINDGKAGPDALPDDPGEVFADSAYRGNHFGHLAQEPIILDVPQQLVGPSRR
ncbi:IS4/IS5 family transposase [Mesorhizobium sp. M1B.F.Ca.ET.045.04.1.1]|nr:IS4/IS5 family transposase [Mesorhizobium sp. M1B.F.Ca.ET.045.04.1.1]